MLWDILHAAVLLDEAVELLLRDLELRVLLELLAGHCYLLRACLRSGNVLL